MTITLIQEHYQHALKKLEQGTGKCPAPFPHLVTRKLNMKTFKKTIDLLTIFPTRTSKLLTGATILIAPAAASQASDLALFLNLQSTASTALLRWLLGGSTLLLGSLLINLNLLIYIHKKPSETRNTERRPSRWQ